MPQFTIYIGDANLARRRAPMSNTIHQVAMEVLGLPENKRFHRFIPITSDNFIYPDDRSSDYTILEIKMFTGRSPETKRKLIQGLFAAFEKNLAHAAMDLEIVILEAPMQDWGIRGVCGDELKLNYTVQT